LAALLATKPGGKEWQTVPTRNRARKMKEVTLVAAKEKEARRLIFRREGLEAPRAKRPDIILALCYSLGTDPRPWRGT
jgi:hypothetical protein